MAAANVNLHVLSNIEVKGQYAGYPLVKLKLKLSAIKVKAIDKTIP